MLKKFTKKSDPKFLIINIAFFVKAAIKIIQTIISVNSVNKSTITKIRMNWKNG